MKVQDVYPPKSFSAQVHMLRKFIHDALGWDYMPTVSAPAILMSLRAAGIVTSKSGKFDFRGRVSGYAFGNQAFELTDITAGELVAVNTLQGSYQQCLEDDITAFDATHSLRRGFQGVVVSLPHHSQFMGCTIIRRDKGPLNSSVVQGLKRVGFTSSKFEKLFEVYSDDQVAARFLITPDFMERLIAFSDDYLGRNVQCAFIGNKFHVTVDIDDRFDFSRDLNVADYQDASTAIINEIGGIFYLLEKMQTLQSRVGAKGSDAVDVDRATYYRGLLETLIPAVKGSLDKFDPVHAVFKEMRHDLPFFCESLHGLLLPRF